MKDRNSLYNRFAESMQSVRGQGDYILICPKGTRKDISMILRQPQNSFRSIKGNEIQFTYLQAQLLNNLLLDDLLIFEYDPTEANQLGSLLVKMISEIGFLKLTERSDYKNFRLWKPFRRRDMYGVWPFSLLSQPRLFNKQDKKNYNFDELGDYYNYSADRLIDFRGNPLIYHLKIDWENLPREFEPIFDFSKPIEYKIGIKSQYSVHLTLYPRDPNNDKFITLSYKYSDWNPIKIQFEFKKANVGYALIAAFLYVVENRKPAVLQTEDILEILRKYSVPVPRKKSFGDAGRLQKSLREKIKKLENKKAKKHLMQIFKKDGNFFRLETSFELEG